MSAINKQSSKKSAKNSTFIVDEVIAVVAGWTSIDSITKEPKFRIPSKFYSHDSQF
jgi:hypothetical protein